VTVSDTVVDARVRRFCRRRHTYVRVSGTGARRSNACEDDRGKGDAHSP